MQRDKSDLEDLVIIEVTYVRQPAVDTAEVKEEEDDKGPTVDTEE